MATFPFTGDPLSQIELIYIGYFGRAGESAGTNFWISSLLAGGSTQATLNVIAGQFSQSAEAKAQYPFLASPLTASPAQISQFIDQVYENLFARVAEAGGKAFWTTQINNALATQNPTVIAAQLGVFIENVALGAQGSDQSILQAKVTVGDYFTQHITVSSLLALKFAHDAVANVQHPGDVGPVEASIDVFALNPPSGSVNTLTIGQDNFNGGTGLDIFNAPLAGVFGNQATLTNGDNLSDTGTGAFPSVLNATFLTGGSDHSKGQLLDGSFLDPNGLPVDHVQGVNITGIATWDIDNVGLGGTVTISGDSAGGKVISGLRTLNYDAHSGEASLLIGNNTEPVQVGPALLGSSFDGFHLNVRDAVGNGDNGVNVDFAAQGFTGTDTIFVTANVVGGFPLDDGGSLILPQPIIFDESTHQHDQDDYNPNWEGFLDDAFAITAGASSGPNKGKNGLPPTGAIGFENWVISSTGAVLLEPGIQFANFNTLTGLNIIALGGEGSWTATTLTLTDDGSSTMLFASYFGDSLLTDWKNLATIDLGGTSGFVILTGLEATNQANEIDSPVSNDGGGLLTMDTTALKTIVGGLGNSFYDLSSLTAATAQAGSWDGGHSHGGNSEIVFNNSVLTGTKPVTLTNIQVLDDASDIQGGTIDMNNFLGLAPLNQPYTLLAGGVIPAGFQLLQLLNSDGSTEATLKSNLFIENGPAKFAINMQDVNDGFYVTVADPLGQPGDTTAGSSGYDISIFGTSIVPNVNSLGSLILYVSDGVSPPGAHEEQPVVGTGSYEQVYNVPHLEIDNYATVDIWIPYEHLPRLDPLAIAETALGKAPLGYDVGLGTVSFLDQPVVTVGADGKAVASVTFHDNTADTGASNPGGPDDLYLGHTQTYDLGTLLTSYQEGHTVIDPLFESEVALIGTSTVSIDTFFHGPLNTIITDLGAGRFEIGATNVFTLHAENTSHLVMDLPATGFSVTPSIVNQPISENLVLDHGITVFGSALGQNLIQGSSGPIQLDVAAEGATDILSPWFLGENDAYVGATGDDVLTGGIGKNGGGDNFFGAGGNDTINIVHGTGGSTSTVWFGAYDIGYSGPHETGTAPRDIIEQAITDGSFTADPSVHNFVNNYATDVTTINGFSLTGTGGDQIVFLSSDWAESSFRGRGVLGLVQWDGQTDTNHNGTVFQTIGSAGATVNTNTDVVLDAIGGAYINAADLRQALDTVSVGDLHFAGGGVQQHSNADMLIAYNVVGGGINIADVTIVNTTGSAITGTAGLSTTALQVHDLVHLVEPVGTGLANINAHNINIIS